MLNSVVKISVMSAKYFEYYTVILGGAFFRGRAVYGLHCDRLRTTGTEQKHLNHRSIRSGSLVLCGKTAKMRPIHTGSAACLITV